MSDKHSRHDPMRALLLVTGAGVFIFVVSIFLIILIALGGNKNKDECFWSAYKSYSCTIKHVDEDAGVVCYESFNSRSISCVKIN